MQVHVLIFFAAQFAASGYAFARGGAPERWVAVLLVVAALIDAALPFKPDRSFHRVEWGALAIDVALLAALSWVALFANRYWPMWVAAIQLDTVAIHGVRAYDPALRAPVYEALAGWAAYPILAALVIATLRHRARAPEPAWSGGGTLEGR